MQLGYAMGYAPPGTNPVELIELAREAERLGYDSAWAAEAWGTDVVSVLNEPSAEAALLRTSASGSLRAPMRADAAALTSILPSSTAPSSWAALARTSLSLS